MFPILVKLTKPRSRKPHYGLNEPTKTGLSTRYEYKVHIHGAAHNTAVKVTESACASLIIIIQSILSVYTHAHTNTHTHTQTPTHTHTYTHTDRHTHTHAHLPVKQVCATL